MIKNLNTLTDRLISLPLRYKAFFSILSGASAALALPPFHIQLLLLAGLSLFYVLLSSAQTAKQGALLGWSFGLGYFTMGLWWIGNALLVEGNEYIWAWPFAVLGLPVMLSLFPALFCMPLIRHFNLQRVNGYCAFLAFLCLSEWLRGHIFTGFPWNLLGYSWANILPVMQILSFGGIYFLTLLSLLWFSCTGFLTVWTGDKKQKRAMLVFVICTFIATYGYGHYRLAHIETTKRDDIVIRLIQASVPQAEKWDQKFFYKNLEKNLALSGNKTSPSSGLKTVIVWPETTLTYHHLDDPTSRSLIKQTLATYDHPVYLFSGMLRRNETGFLNSLVLLDSTLTIKAAYDKSHLVPFGEYIPFQQWIPLAPITAFTGFQTGNGPETLTEGLLPPFGSLICYEIIFPGEITDKNNRPEWLINVTNDAWYGNSPGPYQHLAMVTARAIEEGIPVVRSTNTGISALIGPTGKIEISAGLFESRSIEAALPKTLERATPYSRARDIPFFTAIFFLFALALARKQYK